MDLFPARRAQKHSTDFSKSTCRLHPRDPRIMSLSIKKFNICNLKYSNIKYMKIKYIVKN